MKITLQNFVQARKLIYDLAQLLGNDQPQHDVILGALQEAETRALLDNAEFAGVIKTMLYILTGTVEVPAPGYKELDPLDPRD